jgi:hypothetical protein
MYFEGPAQFFCIFNRISWTKHLSEYCEQACFASYVYEKVMVEDDKELFYIDGTLEN